MPNDENGRPFVKVDWNLWHLRVLRNALNFYKENRVEIFDRTKKELPEPTEAVIEIEKTIDRMNLEFNYHTQHADASEDIQGDI